MGGSIDGYLDCTSPYSYFALIHLRRLRPLLSSYSITLDFHPVFLGGINVGSGNKPPWTLPAKAKLGPYDLKRAIAYFGTEELKSPDFFPILSVVPQRAMLVMKARHDNETFERVWLRCWEYSFVPPNQLDISKPENLTKLLSEFFDKTEVREIQRLAATKEFKDQLTSNTKEALEKGAFGAPWFWMRNGEGVQEPLFGSDRWTYMYKFMGVEFEDLKVLPHGEKGREVKL